MFFLGGFWFPQSRTDIALVACSVLCSKTVQLRSLFKTSNILSNRTCMYPLLTIFSNECYKSKVHILKNRFITAVKGAINTFIICEANLRREVLGGKNGVYVFETALKIINLVQKESMSFFHIIYCNISYLIFNIPNGFHLLCSHR